MTTRIFKFYGKSFSQSGPVAVTAVFNGSQIHSGPVPTVDLLPPTRVTEDLDLLFEYQGTTELSGNIPLELLVTNGTLFFGSVEANYSGKEIEVDVTDPAAPVVVSTITPPENYWADVNQNSMETDGKNNVKINGITQARQPLSPEDIGDWYYRIPQNGTFSCDIFVDPDRIVVD
jgi:hypothetical protein